MKTIAIGADHAGFELKEKIMESLFLKGFYFIDYGTKNTDSVDYPDIIHPLASDINCGKLACGIIICGTGNGVAITANKYDHIRAALCWNEEIAELARKHNDANILSLPARFLTVDEAINIVSKFLNTEFEGGRHLTRVEKINKKIQ